MNKHLGINAFILKLTCHKSEIYTFFLIIILSFVTCDSFSQEKKGYALLIGLSKVDANAYKTKYNLEYSNSAVIGVDNDIMHMKQIFNTYSYEQKILRNENATRANFLNAFREIGLKIKPDDYFVLYYSGHGDQVIDKSGDEKSGFDQVFVTYDDYTLDDSIQVIFEKYFTKTNNVMLVDACHSGTSYKLFSFFIDFENTKFDKLSKSKNFLSEAAIEKNSSNAKPCSYQQTDEVNEPYPLIYYGATSDNSSAIGFPSGGLLTISLYNQFINGIASSLWNMYTYQKLACNISNVLQNSQILQFNEIGKINPSFKNKIPFKIK